MVLVAIHKETGNLIEADSVNYTESITRNHTYWCVLCNDELKFINGHTRTYMSNGNERETSVVSHFRHVDSENNECEQGVNRENLNNKIFISQSKDYINKWMDCVKTEYKYNLHKNVVDVINILNDEIYIKYSMMSLKNINNKVNKKGRIIWILSINSEMNEQPRPCKIYKIYDTNNHLIKFNSKTDIVDFDLSKHEVYLDDNTNIYKLLTNNKLNEEKYYCYAKAKAVLGHLIQKINIDDLIRDVFENILTKKPKFDSQNEDENKVYTKDQFEKINLIQTIDNKILELDRMNERLISRYGLNPSLNNHINIKNMTTNELRKTVNDLEMKIDKNKLISHLFDAYSSFGLKYDINDVMEKSIDEIKVIQNTIEQKIRNKQEKERLEREEEKRQANSWRNVLSRRNIKNSPEKRYLQQSENKIQLSDILNVQSDGIQPDIHEQSKLKDNLSLREQMIGEIYFKAKFNKIVKNVDLSKMSDKEISISLKKINQYIMTTLRRDF